MKKCRKCFVNELDVSHKTVCVCLSACHILFTLSRKLINRWQAQEYSLVSCLCTIFARDSIYAKRAYAIAIPSVCPSVRPTHGWFMQKRLKLGSCSFHHTVAPSLKCLLGKFHPEIRKDSPRARALNESGVGKIRNFQPITHHISETVQDRTKVTINH